MHLGDKIKEAGATGYILLWLLGFQFRFCLLSFCCAAALSPGSLLIPGALVRSGLGVVSHLSVEPSGNKRAGTAGHFRAFS